MKKYSYFKAFGIILLAIVLAPVSVQTQEIIEGHCKTLKLIASYQSPWHALGQDLDLTVQGLAFDSEYLWAVGRSNSESEIQDKIYKLAETDTGLEIIEAYEITFIPKGSGTGIASDLSKEGEPQLWLTDDNTKAIYRVEIINEELVVQESFDPGVADSSGLEKYGKYFWVSGCSGDPSYLYKIREKKDVMDVTMINAPGYCHVGIAYDGSFIWSVDQMWVQNLDGDKIYKLSTAGKELCSYDFSEILDHATGITFDDDNHMWVGDRGNIYKLEFEE